MKKIKAKQANKFLLEMAFLLKDAKHLKLKLYILTEDKASFEKAKKNSTNITQAIKIVLSTYTAPELKEQKLYWTLRKIISHQMKTQRIDVIIVEFQIQ